MMSTPFVSAFLSTFDQDNDHHDIVSTKNGCAIVYKVKLKPGKTHPTITLQQKKSYIVKLVEPTIGAFGRSRVEESELLSPLGRVKREVDVILEKRMEHRNVVRMFGCWVEHPPVGFDGYPHYGQVRNAAGILFILMEYCDLYPLTHWLLTPSDHKQSHAKILFRQLMEGIAHLHSPEYSVIHRDLKPENIVLTSDLPTESVVLKIIDFGLATEKRSKMTSRIGTVWYRAPELRSEGDNRYKESVDIYPAGIILSLLLVAPSKGDEGYLRKFDRYMWTRNTGDSRSGPQVQPFDPEDFFRTFKVDGVSLELLNLARRMTSRDPQQRPTAKNVLDEFDSLFPEVKGSVVPSHEYLSEERLKTYEFTSPDGSFHDISPQRLLSLTSLTLLNVHLTTSDLHSNLSYTPSLQVLHLGVKFTDLQDLQTPIPLPQEFYTLQTLQTLVFQEILEELDGVVSQVSPERLQSLTLTLPFSQIWRNRMRIQLTFGSQTYIDINVNSNYFHCRGFSSKRFLEVLNHLHTFQCISLRGLRSPLPADIQEGDWIPGLTLQEQCTSLNLHNVPLDLQGGKLFARFLQLKSLHYSCPVFDSSSSLSFQHLPGKCLQDLFLSKVALDLGGYWELSLESLHLTSCKIPLEITEAFSSFSLKVASDFLLRDCRDFLPNSKLLYAVMANIPKRVRLHPFDRSLSGDDMIDAAAKVYLSDLPEHSTGIELNENQDGVLRFHKWEP